MLSMPLNAEIARKLCALTSAFYEAHAESFSATRHAPWAGWRRCLDLAREAGVAGEGRRALSVLDVACGNLRFEDFLAKELPATDLAIHAVDGCDDLVASAARAFGLDDARGGSGLVGASIDAPTAIVGGLASGDATGPSTCRRGGVAYRHLDVIDALFSGDLAERLSVPPCDLSVSFGFMHHVPLPAQREAALSTLVERTRPGGLVAVSFWRFLNSEALAAKARETHARACADLGLPELAPGDFMLGWKDEPGAYRYCHSFSEEEIDRLLASVSDRADVLACFDADGRTGDLNEYVVLRVR